MKYPTPAPWQHSRRKHEGEAEAAGRVRLCYPEGPPARPAQATTTATATLVLPWPTWHHSITKCVMTLHSYKLDQRRDQPEVTSDGSPGPVLFNIKFVRSLVFKSC
ncbi:hypothetical protein E2C01_009368 [Portunus trituberculatus]|uniref:Uncharacterized protein n=1 Tax=Portunus trituberculatus TaxID=210409 RepID=A0A5B7D4W1_PORTR|nr:hypothetical protein [Portunus trituberculatus]